MKHWTKKYWLTLLTVLCALLFAGCSTATTTSQATTQETTAAQNETLDGTWELTDVKTTLRKSFVLRGADPTQYAYAIDDLADWKPQLVISGNEAEFKYSYNFTKYYENLYEHIYKNAFPDKSEFKSVLYDGYAKILPALKVTKIEMDKETNQFDFSLPEGAIDTSNKTITFKETPTLLMTFSLGITMQPARPITYQYELDGDTLVVSARGNNERGVLATMKMTFKKVTE